MLHGKAVRIRDFDCCNRILILCNVHIGLGLNDYFCKTKLYTICVLKQAYFRRYELIVRLIEFLVAILLEPYTTITLKLLLQVEQVLGNNCD